jgi:N-(5-amino-5-carboxypentanoyl)-L-cysteinyl-D-valine synthase
MQRSDEPGADTGSESQHFDHPSEIGGLGHDILARKDLKQPQRNLASIGGRCDLNSLLLDGKRYHVDLRSRYITEHRASASATLVSLQDLESVCVKTAASLDAILLFAWHKTLSVFAHGDTTVVLLTDEKTQSSSMRVPGSGSSVSIVEHDEQRNGSCLDAIRSLEVERLPWKINEADAGLLDSHILLCNYESEPLGAFLLHPITATLRLPATPSEGIELDLLYAGELFPAEVMRGFCEVLQVILTQVISSPSSPVDGLQYLSDAQGRELDDWNCTDDDYDRTARLEILFETAVAASPSATAVVYRDHCTTYEALNADANRIANHISQLVAPEQIVALFLDKSELMIAAVIGIWKSGAAYTPIDPSYPDSRCTFALQDTNATVIMCNARHVGRVKTLTAQVDSGIAILELEPLLERLRGDPVYPCTNPGFDLHSGQLAYLTYTSGTTGVPKGIKKRHTNVVNSITDLANRYGMREGREAVVLFSPYVFEPFARQTLMALINSQTLIVVNDDEKMDPVTFTSLMRKHRVTYLNGTASVLQEFDYTDCPDLKRLVLVGEDLTSIRYKALRRKFSKCIINEYGFTESAFVTAIKIFQPNDDRPNRSLGRPLRNVKCYVLDAAMKRVPIGAIGELFIGGQGVFQGYLNRPKLTKERFLSNPYQTASEKDRGANSTMYRTGDLARWIPGEKEIEYLGRNDFQIKLRGIRIEPGEIESVLASYPGIDRVVVVARTAGSNTQSSMLGSLHLVGYWAGLESLQESDLVVFLESKLPRYMVPTRLFRLDRLPTTINGKIDFRALPGVDLVPQQKGDAIFKPANPTQEILRAMWGELLNLPPDSISVNDNFFRLGGTSITCIQLSGKVRQRFRARLNVEDVFAGKTIERLALMMRPLEVQKTACASLSADETGITSDTDGVYIANSLQQGFVFNYLKRNRHDDAYTMQYISTYNTSIDTEQYRAAWLQSQQRFSALRLRFVLGDEVYQVIDQYQPLDFRTIDISQLPDLQTRERILAEIQNSDRREHYELDRGSLFRVYLIQWSSSAWKLLFSCHHAIMDGWSVPILLDHVHETYAFPHVNEDPRHDDVYHESQGLLNSLRQENLPYWREQVGIIEDRCDLRGLVDNSMASALDLASYDSIQSPKETTINLGMKWKADLESVYPESEITLHSVLQFVCHKVLNAFGNGRQSVVGTVVSGRELPVSNIEAAVGLYINTLPLIVDHQTQRKSTVFEAIQNIQHSVISMNKRSTVDLAQLSPGKMTHDLFDCLLVLENYPELDKRKRQRLEKELSMSTEVTTEKLTYSLAFVCKEAPDGDVHITLRYASELFTEGTIHEVLEVFRSVFEQLPTKMFHPVATLEILGSNQIARFDSWNSSQVDYPQLTLACMFEDMAAKFSTKTSIIYEDESMTYAELNTASNRLARTLNASVHARPSKIIGLLLQKGISMFVAILAVWKAGMAYTPIDPTFPSDRINYILEDTEALAVLTSRAHLATVAALSASPAVLCVEEILRTAEPSGHGDANLERTTCGTDLAYVYFTSGTTGRPKGVMVEHRGVVNLQQALCRTFGLAASQHPDEVILSFSNYTFDHFVEVLTDALLSGQTLLILNDEMRADKDRLYAYIAKHRVTYLSGTPSVISMYDWGEFPSLRRIDCIGEDFSEAVFNKIRRDFGGLIINGYGPTEVSITTHKRLYLPGERRSNKSIGFQIDNSRTYVLNQDMRRVPIGAVGELYLGGDGVARGYLNLHDLTADRFPVNPFQTVDEKLADRNGRLYKTGDLVRWLPTGEIEYLGRDDHQIKLRGQRVELGEIEAALNSCTYITRSAVVPRIRHLDGSDVAQQFLIGYFIATQILSELDIRSQLWDRLPEHLIPNRFVQVQVLPVTISGKLDTKSLPDVDYVTTTLYEAPQNDVERRLCIIWGTLLGIPESSLSVMDDFFSLGGDSLSSTKLAFLTTKHFARNITVAHIFKHRMIRSLATFILDDATKVSFSGFAKHKSVAAKASLAQERLLFIDNFSGGSSAYNVLKYLRLPASTCVQRLKSALASLIDRHAALRTILQPDSVTKVTMQRTVVLNTWQKEKTMVDVDLATQKELDAVLDVEARHCFDLNNDVPIRTILARVANLDEMVLAFNIHHTAFDAWSWKIVLRDLAVLYQAGTCPNRAAELPKLPITYGDYSTWQRSHLGGERGKAMKAYWIEEMQGFSAVELTTDFSRPKTFQHDGQDLELLLEDDMPAKVAYTARSAGTSTFCVYFTAYCLLLSAYTNQQDLVIGVPMANRQYRELENLVGFFINMVALRIKIDSTLTLEALISDVQRKLQEAQLNQDFPFDELVHAIEIDYSSDRHPIFQHVFGSDIISAVAGDGDGDSGVSRDTWPLVEYQPIDCIHSSSKFDLSTTVIRRNDQTIVNFNFPKALFTSQSVSRLSETYARILAQLVDADMSTSLVKGIRLVEESLQLAPSMDRERKILPPAESLGQLFDRCASLRSSSLAVVCHDKSLTYKQLLCRSNRLANYLEALGVRTGDFIGLLLEPSVEMIVCIVAAWKIGAAYVPILAVTPQPRLAHIVQDASIAVFLTQSMHVSRGTWPTALKVVPIDDGAIKSQIEQEAAEFQTQTSTGTIAYCIYTSGTTGIPKGVLVPHLGVVRLAEDLGERYFGQNPEHSEAIPLISSFAFDFSVEQLALSLLSGNKLVVLPDGITAGDGFYEYLNRESVTYLSGTPSVISALDLSRFTSLRMVTSAGEQLHRNQFESMRAGFPGPINNAYGTTESTVYNLVRRYDAHAAFINALGHPISGQQAYVANDNLQLVPSGAVGELLLSGDGFAVGYLNQPDFTSKRFLPNPFLTDPDPDHATVYRTGDLVRRLPDGTLEFHGRNDQQVKLRGFRIELGEIQALLGSHPAVATCVVLPEAKLCGSKGHADRLAAYYTVPERSGYTPNSGADLIRQYLEERLPPYAVPSQIVFVQGQLPVTTTGKLDVARLPDPNAPVTCDKAEGSPTTTTEKLLCELWSALLTTKVGIHDDFFRSGGDSLLSLQIVRNIAQHANIKVTVKHIFEYRTISKVLQHCESSKFSTPGGARVESSTLTGLVDLLPIQQWFFDKPLTYQNHWNQCFIVRTPRLDFGRLSEAYSKLQRHHGAFRISFHKADGKMTQRYNAGSVNVDLQYLDSSDPAQLSAKLSGLQESFDLAKGQVAAAAYIEGSDHETATIWFAMHHLVVDTESWRIISSDLQRLYDEPTLPLVTSSSYRQWSSAMKTYAPTAEETHHWQSLLASSKASSAHGHHPEDNANVTLEVSDFELDTVQRRCQTFRHAGLHDLLLTVLSRALYVFDGGLSPVITLEGHGREIDDSTLDVSSTVGWFTSMFPFRLHYARDISAHIQQVATALLQVPNKGVGFGALHGYSKLPQVTFNHLGRISPHNVSNTAWKLEPGLEDLWGRSRARCDEAANTSILDVTTWIQDGTLYLNIATRLGRTKTDALVTAFQSTLAEVSEYVQSSPTEQLPAPADQSVLDSGIDFVPFFRFLEEPRSGPILFLLPPGEGGAESYFHNLVTELKTTRLVVFNNLHLHNPDPDASYEKLARRYVSWLRQSQPQGPYHIMGWSFGGVLALEICLQLLSAGEAIASLSFIDPYFAVAKASMAAGLLNDDGILDPINWHYMPSKDRLLGLERQTGTITLFKAGLQNERAKNERQEKLFALYQDSKYNGLDEWIDPGRISVIQMAGETHFTWVKNRDVVMQIAETMANIIT